MKNFLTGNAKLNNAQNKENNKNKNNTITNNSSVIINTSTTDQCNDINSKEKKSKEVLFSTKKREDIKIINDSDEEDCNEQDNTTLKLNDKTDNMKSDSKNIQSLNTTANITIGTYQSTNSTKTTSNTIKTNDNTNSSSIEFKIIAEALNEVESCKGENSKDRKEEILSEIFLKVITEFPNDLINLYNFLLSKIGPEYRCPELGIGKEALLKCVSKATGKSDKYVKEEMKEIGDLSLIAAKGKSTMGTVDKFKGFTINKVKKPLLLKQIMEGIYRLAEIKGKDSMDEKEKIMLKLLFDSSSVEIKFLVRSLEKSLKIGASFKTIMASLSRAISKFYKIKARKEVSSKKIDKIIQKCIFQLCDYDLIIDNLLSILHNKSDNKDIEDIETLLVTCQVIPGIPIKPMLAKPTTGVNMVANRFENIPFTCEYKYDGFRGQIHYVKDKTKEACFQNPSIQRLNLFKNTQIQVFSRNLENMTTIYPDIVEYFSNLFSKNNNIDSCILDCEIVPFDGNTDKILPFQLLTMRSRTNVQKEDITIRVCCFLFDIIMLNSEILMEKSLEERRVILKETFAEDDKVKITKYINSNDPDEIIGFMDESIKAGCEGLIVKALNVNSSYQPGERNFNWLKLKKDYLTDSTIGDSLDLVPIGAVYGKGKRTGTYGSFLLACYNEDSEIFETVSMTGAGLKEEDLKHFYSTLQEYIIDAPLKNYKCGDLKKEVNVWFEPKLVWEIKTADLSLSPVYTSAEGLTNDGKGISLRFPRFIRTREDKKPEEATTSEQIFKMYNEQAMNEKNIKKYTEEISSDEE